MWNDLTILFSIVVGVLGLAYLVGFLKRNDLFDEDDLQKGKEILELVELVFNVVNKDEKLKNRANFIADLANVVIDYVANILDDETDREGASLEVIQQVLDKLEIEPTEDEWKLIEVIVTRGLAYYKEQK